MRRSVLIVDDHATVRGMVCSLFKAEGFAVCEAENGVQAVARAQELHPDLIVLDLAMPVMNGLEAARKLKLLMPHVPLMMFTNTVGPVTDTEAHDAGISAVVSKSESPDNLIVHAKVLLSS